MPASNIVLRKLTLADAAAAAAVAEAAFGRPGLQPDLERLLVIEPQGWWLALLADRPVGMVGAVDFGPVAYIGMMTVHPADQRRGIGRALFTALLDELTARGCPAALLDATDMGAPLYRQAGFVEDGVTHVFHRADLAQTLPSQLKGVLPAQPEDWRELAAFDAPRYGADRGRALRVLLRDYAGRAFLTRDAAGQLTGYLIAQEQRLGPWVTASPAAAETLLRAALSLPFNGPALVQTPGCAGAQDLLARYGFERQRTLLHMRYPAQGAHPGCREEILGLASFSLG